MSGRGTRETLKEVKKIIPNLKIKSFKSGKKVFDWKIPLEWEVKNAYIITPDGKKICNYENNRLHLVGYSSPIKKVLSKKKNYQKTLFFTQFKNCNTLHHFLL